MSGILKAIIIFH